MAVPVRRREGFRTPVRRWDPFRELDELQQRTAELLESSVSGGDGETRPWIPAVDIEETEDAWHLEAEVPGVRREDVNVELRDQELEISGEIKEREREGVLRRRTRRVGQFDFRVTLPGQADPSKVEAKLHDGVLTVRVPKPEPARARRIEIQAD
jgi:HSP20 family protein